MSLSHIRKPLPRKGGNNFYRDKRERVTETLCGASVTDKDVDFRTAGTKQFISGTLAWSLCVDCACRRVSSCP